MEISGIQLEELEFENIGSWPLLFRQILIGCIFVITLLVGYFFILSDKWDALSKARDKRLSLERSFAETQHQVANLGAYKEQVKKVQEELNKLTQQLPQATEAAALLEDISNQAASSGVQISSIKPGVQEFRGFYVENPVELTLFGNFHSFGAFASNISSMPRIVTLHNFTIKTKEQSEKEGAGPLTMVVQAKTYWTSGKEHK